MASGSTPRDPELAYRDDSLDDPSAPLLDSPEEPKPRFEITFSTVIIFRALSMILSIACAVLAEEMGRGAEFMTVIFSLVAALNGLHVVKYLLSLWVGKRSSKAKAGKGKARKIGFAGYAITVERQGKPRILSLLVAVVDVVFIIQSIVCTSIAQSDWVWRDSGRSIAIQACGGFLIVLHSLAAILRHFSVFRRSRITIYAAEDEDEKAAMRSVQLPIDD